MSDLMSMPLHKLMEAVEEMGEKKFRAKQLYSWLHEKLIFDYHEMSNLSAAFRQQLSEQYPLPVIKEVKRYVSKLDGTTKYLFELFDGNIIESVLMKYKHGNSVCISSQVGCRMGCAFCASTLDGLLRNLSASEMLMQVYLIQHLSGERVSNVVVMGTGEPFDNYESLMAFLHIITSEQGLHISQRNITVSTCGIVPRIYDFAKEGLSVTLAVSLHAPTDEMRKRLMPIAYQYSIEEILKACHYFVGETGRRVTFEYSLVKGENDSEEHARLLAGLLKGLLCHVNLIPVNPISERDYVQSERESIEKFKNMLEKYQINVTIRREMGRDIAAACGQLRRDFKQGGTQ